MNLPTELRSFSQEIVRQTLFNCTESTAIHLLDNLWPDSTKIWKPTLKPKKWMFTPQLHPHLPKFSSGSISTSPIQPPPSCSKTPGLYEGCWPTLYGALNRHFQNNCLVCWSYVAEPIFWGRNSYILKISEPKRDSFTAASTKFSIDMKHAISARWLANPRQSWHRFHHNACGLIHLSNDDLNMSHYKILHFQ